MADYRVADSDLVSVANAIRTKGGTSSQLSFPDGFISAIGDISTGGSTLVTKLITENGTYNAASDNADGYSSVTVATQPKIVTGTFEGSSAEKGSAKSVTIPYTGTGYPVAGLIYPSNGTNKSGDTFASLVQDRVEVMFSFIKQDVTSAPSYANNNADENKYTVGAVYKYSTTTPLSYSSGKSEGAPLANEYAASNTYANCVRFTSNTTMTVYIADTTYGFPDGVEYTYWIIYSA